MKHLKRYNSLIFESLTKNISDDDIKSVTKNIRDDDIEERVQKVVDYIRNNPQEKTGKLSELEDIMKGLWRDMWLDEDTKDSDAYQLWFYHYKGFTKENMKALIAGVKTKLVEEEANKIIAIAKEFLQKNPTSKDFFLQSLTNL
jgi:hypothetical protein